MLSQETLESKLSVKTKTAEPNQPIKTEAEIHIGHLNFQKSIQILEMLEKWIYVSTAFFYIRYAVVHKTAVISYLLWPLIFENTENLLMTGYRFVERKSDVLNSWFSLVTPAFKWLYNFVPSLPLTFRHIPFCVFYRNINLLV